MPIPLIYDVNTRLQDLKDYLKNINNYFCRTEENKSNVRAVIEAYESGAMPDKGVVYFKRGRMVDAEEGRNRDSLVWEEHVGVTFRQ